MANKILIVAKREYMERVRSRTFIVMTLLIPALMAGAILIPTYMSARGGVSASFRHIRILDATGAGLGDRVATLLQADTTAKGDTVSGPFVQAVAPGQLAAAESSAVREVMTPKSLTGYLVLDDSTLAGKRARYAGRNASSVTDMDKLESAVRQSVMMVRLEHEGVNKQTIDDLAKSKLQLASERLTEKGRGGSGLSGLFAGVIVGVMLLMAIIVHGQNVMRGVLEEKTSRVAEVVISSIKPESLLAGKVVGVGGVGLTQIVAWLAIGGYLINFFMPILMKNAGAGAAMAAGSSAGPSAAGIAGMSFGVLGISIAYFLLGFVFYATLFAAAGSMVNSEQEAQQAVMPVMLLLMSGWIFVNPVLINPNSTLAVVLSWLPWASPIIMPIRMGLTAVSPLSVAGSLVLAFVGSLGAVWLAARIYRVGMLMYGKKPSFGELAKWIRYA
ncbi:MAG TPA: ABC transporter permease [Gemmatimonadaceae bacterium]|nr:ABC transporter permease [Gemmatimonadaceae bacterium]